MIPVAHVSVEGLGYTVYISICMLSQQVHIFKYSEQLARCTYDVCTSQQEAQAILARPLT